MGNERKDPMVRDDGRVEAVQRWIVDAAIEYGHAKCFNMAKDNSTSFGWCSIESSTREWHLNHLLKKLGSYGEDLVRSMALPLEESATDGEYDVGAEEARLSAEADRLVERAASLRAVAEAMVNAAKVAKTAKAAEKKAATKGKTS